MAVEKKKYIIELDDNTLAYTAILINGVPYIKPLQLLPYTEPDLEQIRKEAYDKCMDEAEMLAYKLYSPKIDEAYKKGLSDGKNQDAKDFADMYDSGYSEGLKDAWNAARKIACDRAHGGFHIDTKRHIFGASDYAYILANYTASEAVERIRQYEQEPKEAELKDAINTIMAEGGYTIESIYNAVKEMRE